MMQNLRRFLCAFALCLVAVSFAVAQQNKPKSPTGKSLSSRSAKFPEAPQVRDIPNMRSRVIAGLEHYDRLSFAKNLNVTLVMGNEPCVVAQAEPTVVKALRCEVQGGHLYISLDPCKFKRSSRVYVTINVDSTFCEVNGDVGGNVWTQGVLHLRRLTLNTGFASASNLSLYADEWVRINAVDKSNVWLYGSAPYVDIHALRSSIVLMKGIEAQRVDVEAVQESQVEATAISQLSILASERAIVRYKTSPGASVSSNVEQGGSVGGL